jgi:hypothetical protein
MTKITIPGTSISFKKGGLHRSLGVPVGKPIGKARIEAATHSKKPVVRKQAQLAETMMGFNHKHVGARKNTFGNVKTFSSASRIGGGPT